MNPQRTWLVAAALLCPIAAQESVPPPPDVKTRLGEFEKERDRIITEWRAEVTKAAKAAEENKEPGATVPAMRMRPDFSELRAKYLAAAGDDPRNAVAFLVPALNLSDGKQQYREIIDRLVADHLDDPAVFMIGSYLGALDRMVDADYQQQVIAKIEAHGENPTLLAWIAFQRNEPVLRQESALSPAFAKAKAAVATAIANAEDPRLKQMFDQLVTEQEKFGIGMVAPDIAGIDLDGVSFKLSDYKGKVVFLDFWGDW